MSPEKANRPGARLENWVTDVLEAQQYQYVRPGRFFAARELEQPIYTRQFEIGKDIYGKKRRVDFILYHPHLWPDCLVIQCKWQASRGSVEEKYPFEVLSIGLNEFQTIVVLDGGGYSAGSEKWLRSQVGKNKLLYVMSMGDISRFGSQGRI